MNTYQPMNCDLYDYLEIACLRGYRLDIELKDGARLEARALDTRTSAEKEEFLRVETANGQQEIRLDQLLAVTPLDANAQFGRVVFTDAVCTF
ncbi:Rho-binding antiterminator [Pseudomonas sp. TNT2022 ID1044]|uniref:Rho-binding antiterminator n=1 Tax=Pseudomonas sp. TNT2022 ID1044 TaxID=2942636 RepID=UPI00236286B6|nr:Rho-binding antiterminator [Pseudomonas sp. TNT2022 ID1044]MDD0994739.1 Rho-binding antiterminator [Pseudomonas sp. TNT2022 ID1044]